MAQNLKIKIFVNQRAFSCNVYVCSAGECSFIVDLGYYDSEIENYLKTIPPVKFVLQTHGHFDHIMGINAFAEKNPGVEYYCFNDEIEVITNSRKNGSILAGTFYQPKVNFKTLSEGKINLFGFDIDVIHTPGHTAGSCMFSLENEKVVFTGDTLIETSIGRTDLPTGNENDIYNSLKKIKALTFSDDTEFYFGHGASFKYVELIKYNSFLS